MSADLSDKVILVTGASRGIGRATASHCANLGARIGACYLRQHDSAYALQAEHPTRISLLPFDVRNAQSVTKNIHSFIERAGGVDVLINCAGVFRSGLIVRGMKEEHLIEQIHTNALGAYNCSAAVLPKMISRRRGLIINISSVAAVYPVPGQTAYAMSKAAVEALTRCLAVEYGKKGIRALTVRFGPIATDMLSSVEKGAATQYRQRLLTDYIEEAPAAAGLLTFLASQTCGYATGSCIDWDGGYGLGSGAHDRVEG